MELSSRAISQPIYFLMWSNLGHLPLGKLYVVINDGYLAQVPEGAEAHLHNTDRYNTRTPGPDRTGQACSRLESGRQVRWVSLCDRQLQLHAVYFCCQVVAALFKQVEFKLCRISSVQFNFCLPKIETELQEHHMKVQEDPLAVARWFRHLLYAWTPCLLHSIRDHPSAEQTQMPEGP